MLAQNTRKEDPTPIGWRDARDILIALCATLIVGTLAAIVLAKM
jgi:hypothetical protein